MKKKMLLAVLFLEAAAFVGLGCFATFSGWGYHWLVLALLNAVLILGLVRFCTRPRKMLRTLDAKP